MYPVLAGGSWSSVSDPVRSQAASDGEGQLMHLFNSRAACGPEGLAEEIRAAARDLQSGDLTVEIAKFEC